MKSRRRDAFSTTVIAFAVLIVALAVCAAARAEWATVARVNDGDTFVLADGRRVRLIGVDAPEIDHERRIAEPCGFEAREAVRRMVEGGRVRLALDRETRDRYGRVLAYVYLEDGAMVNAELLRGGLAMVLYRQPNVTHHGTFLDIQREAMAARRGLWRRVDERPEAVVGNRRSMRFHLKTCPAARGMHPDNRVPFQKKWDAFQAGYAPSRDCIPRMFEPRK